MAATSKPQTKRSAAEMAEVNAQEAVARVEERTRRLFEIKAEDQAYKKLKLEDKAASRLAKTEEKEAECAHAYCMEELRSQHQSGAYSMPFPAMASAPAPTPAAGSSTGTSFDAMAGFGDYDLSNFASFTMP